MQHERVGMDINWKTNGCHCKCRLHRIVVAVLARYHGCCLVAHHRLEFLVMCVITIVGVFAAILHTDIQIAIIS